MSQWGRHKRTYRAGNSGGGLSTETQEIVNSKSSQEADYCLVTYFKKKKKEIGVVATCKGTPPLRGMPGPPSNLQVQYVRQSTGRLTQLDRN